MSQFTHKKRIGAVIYGGLCHAAFLVAVTTMIYSTYFGFNRCWGTLDGVAAFFVNAALLIQFPLLHSWLLTPSGRRLMRSLPWDRTGEMVTTTFALVASLQLIFLFLLWSPSGGILWEAHGPIRTAFNVAYVFSWLMLGKAMQDAGLGVQTGSIGWMSVARGKKPKYPGMPTQGLFKTCRQPIYLAFALALWTAPVWTIDRIALVTVWTTYLFFAPKLKEARYKRLYGQEFESYRSSVPYWVPKWQPVRDAVGRYATAVFAFFLG